MARGVRKVAIRFLKHAHLQHHVTEEEEIDERLIANIAPILVSTKATSYGVTVAVKTSAAIIATSHFWQK